MFGVALGIFVPHYVIGWMGRRRVNRFYGLFPEAIDLMVRALRAGLPVTEAIINAGQEIGDPVGTEFRGIEAGMRLGRDLDSLLWEIAKRITLPEFRFFIIALSVQRETGGNLAETLNNLSEVLRRRRAMRAKARAMASEARASTMILRFAAGHRHGHPDGQFPDLHLADVHRYSRTVDAGRRGRHAPARRRRHGQDGAF